MIRGIRRLAALAWAAVLSACATTPSQVSTAESNRFELDPTYWRSVPCEIVGEKYREGCLAEHSRIGIAPNETVSSHQSRPPKSEEDGAKDFRAVPCVSVKDEEMPACIAAHDRAGLSPGETLEAELLVDQPPQETVALEPFGEELIAPATGSRPSCGYAGDGYRPIVDTAGVDTGRYECDLRDCQAYASQVSPGRSAVANAIGGAIFGALIGLAVGDHGWAARAGAQGGAIGGALGGAGSAVAAQTNIVRNCMAGRGYRVLQ